MVKTMQTRGKAALKEKLKKQAGFTLVELLIVVAIIAILAAVAIPAYATQMERSREAVDASNARAASSMASADYLLQGYKGEVTYKFNKTAEGNIQISGATVGSDDTAATYPTEGTEMSKGESNKCNLVLTVTVKANGVLGKNTWMEKLNDASPAPTT